MALEYFPFYYSYRKKMARLSDQEVGRLVRALLKYGETGEAEELAGRESVAFDFIADDIDRAKASYGEKCSKNKRNADARYERMPTDANACERSQTKEKEKTKENISTTATYACARDEGLGRVVSLYLDKIDSTPSQTSMDELKGYVEAMDAEVCERAINNAIDAGSERRNWRYIRGNLSSWQSMGVKCTADIERLDKKPERTSGESKRFGKSTPGWGDTDRSASKAMLRDMAELEMILKGEEGG